MSQNSCSLPKPPYMFSPNPPNKYVMSPCPSSVSASSQASSASSSPCLMNYSPKHSRIPSISSRNTKNLLLNLQNDIKSEIRRDLGVETKGERDKSTQKVLPLTPLNSIHTPQLPPIQNAKGLMDSSLPIVHDSSLQFPDFNFNPPHDSYKYSTTVQSDNNRDLAFQQIPVDDKTASKDSIKTVLQSNNTNPANSGAETPPHIFLRQVPPTFTTSGLNISMLGSGLFSRSLKSTVAGQSTSFSDQKLFPEAYDQSPLLLNPINPFLDDAKLQSPIHFPKNSMSDSSPEVSQKEHSEIDRSAIISIVSDYKYDSPLTQRDQNSPQIPDNAAYLSSNSKQNASQSGEILAIDEKLAQIELPEPTISPSPLSKEGSPKKQITPQEKNSVNSNGRENLAEPSPKRTRSKQLPEKPLPPLPPLETVEQYLVSPSRQRLYQFAYKHEVPEELQETVAIDAYPNGPKNVLNSKLFLYSDPANADLDINDFDLVINVAKECPDLSKTFRSGPNREYLLVPWSHTSAISKELPAIVSRIDEYYRDDRKILVHCQCGVSRSACVIVAYFMYSFNIGVNQAYELLKSGTKTGSGDSIMERIAKQGYTIDACERICPNMGLLFELMEFGDKKNGVMV